MQSQIIAGQHMWIFRQIAVKQKSCFVCSAYSKSPDSHSDVCVVDRFSIQGHLSSLCNKIELSKSNPRLDQADRKNTGENPWKSSAEM